MTELQKQEQLSELLNTYFKLSKIKARAYCKNSFKRIDGNWANKPDLIIVDAPIINIHWFKQPEVMRPVIGIEMKDETGFTDITSGIAQTKKYIDYKYCLPQENFEFKLSSLAFTTTNAIKQGIIDKDFQDNKAIERFAWQQRIAILINYNNELCWSFRNYYFKLNGEIKGRFGEHAKFIEY
jgi:hypothetical protein